MTGDPEWSEGRQVVFRDCWLGGGGDREELGLVRLDTERFRWGDGEGVRSNRVPSKILAAPCLLAA